MSTQQLINYPKTRNVAKGTVVPIHANPDYTQLVGESSRKITDANKATMSVDQLQKVMGTTYGGPSKILNKAFDSFHNVNGGKFESCLSNEYLKDFITDLQLKDSFRQDVRDLQATVCYRRDNIA